MTIQFSQRALDAIFPFSMGTDASGLVVTIGRSLKKMVPTLRVGEHFSHCFKITTPDIGAAAYQLNNLAEEIVTLELIDRPLRFKGQVAPLEEEDARTFLFVISPFFTDIGDISKAGLDFGDFALFDPIFDLLMLIQSERRASLESAESKHRLEEANGVLQQEMSERLTIERSLQLAKDAAEAANRAKSQFLANMSHEIRTPLNAIIGTSSVLVSEAVDADMRLHLDRIRSSGDHLLALINDILDFSKIEAGELSLERLDFDLVSLLDDVVGLIGETAQAKGLQITTRLHGGVPPVVSGDPGRIRQVLINLLSNSVKFTESGKVTLSVRRRDLDSRSEDLIFEVQDTGIGVPMAKQLRLFRPFSQADESDTRRYGGTGLGLAISKSLVEKMGGRIFMVSEPGVGTSFQVCLPLSVPTSLACPFPRHAYMRALIVCSAKNRPDDLAEQLNDWGFLTVTARTVDAAVAHWDAALGLGMRFDLIIIDHDASSADLRSQLQAAVIFTRESSPAVIELLPQGQDVTAALPQSTPLRKPLAMKQFKKALGLVGASTATDGIPLQAAIAGSAPTLAGRPLRVLVAEDNLLNQEVVKAMLGRLQHSFEIAGDGRVAVECAEGADYDLILMDCQMPEMDGFDATRRIRALRGRKAETPIIAMTANAIKGDRERCLEAGMDDYLAKPVKIDDLKALLIKWSERLSVRFGQGAETVAVESPVTHPVTETSDLAPLLDMAALTVLASLAADGSNSFLQEQVGHFLTDSLATCESIVSLVNTAQFDEAARLAHRFKTSCGIVGAVQLASVCEAVETAAETREFDKLATMLGAFARHCEATNDCLKAYVARDSKAA